VRICIQSLKKVLKRAKTFCIKILNLDIKNAEFYADFESVTKDFKKCTEKKLLAKP
jgi:hypothetical protein